MRHSVALAARLDAFLPFGSLLPVFRHLPERRRRIDPAESY
jgi:hypothetical protein